MKYSVIIQGEGKGHFSQAMEAIRQLRHQGHEITGCYVSKSLFHRLPQYFRKVPGLTVRSYLSPNFIRTPDRKGIRVLLSLILNMLFIPVYLFEIFRLGSKLRKDRSDRILNFYEPVGALAGRWMKKKAKKILVSHHFYLSHPDFIHPHGLERSYFWLQLMNRIMIGLADRVLALSFRKGKMHGKIEVVPPLIFAEIRNLRDAEASAVEASEDNKEHPGNADLCYFLQPGFVEEILEYYSQHPELNADIFAEQQREMKVPENVTIHTPDREKFIALMHQSSRIICTAGFDTVAEAFFLGIPVFVIPSLHHYEQYCNALDAARTGMAYHLDTLSELAEASFTPRSNEQYIQWVGSGNALFD